MHTKKQCKAKNILYKYHDIFSLFFPVWEKVVRKYCENSVIFSEISQKFVKSSIFLFFSQIVWFEKKSYFLQIFWEKENFWQKMIFFENLWYFLAIFPSVGKSSEKISRKFCHFLWNAPSPPMSIFSQMDQFSADLRIKMHILGNLVSFFFEKMTFFPIVKIYPKCVPPNVLISQNV